MRLGLIADVHEAIEFLAAVLELFRREGVDRVVCAGDLVGAGDRLDEAAALMAGADVACVWGNHDYPLCRAIAAGEAGAHRPAATLDYFRTLRPRLEVGGAHFSHVEPWLDLGDPADLCYYGPPPETAEAAARSCAAVPHLDLPRTLPPLGACYAGGADRLARAGADRAGPRPALGLHARAADGWALRPLRRRDGAPGADRPAGRIPSGPGTDFSRRGRTIEHPVTLPVE